MPALAALLAALFAFAAAVRPHGLLAVLAALSAAVALALRLPTLGTGTLLLALAAGLAAAAAWVKPDCSERRPLLLLAACLAILAAPLTPSHSAATVPAYVASALAGLLALAAVASAALYVCGGGARLWLAGLVALAPQTPVVRWLTEASLDTPQSAARIVLPVVAQAKLPTQAWLAGLAPETIGLLLALPVLVAWAGQHRSVPRFLTPHRTLAAAGAAVALLAGQAIWLALTAQPTLALADALLSAAPAGPVQLDAAPLAWLAARVALLAWLLRPTPVHVHSDGGGHEALVAAQASGLLAGLALLAVWLLHAEGWHGAAWPADPAAAAVGASIAASCAGLATLGRGSPAGREAAHLLQLAAAAVLVGSVDAGWSVAGVLLP